jgi:lipoprotein-anchoring transpeptidase ErfK/SrfK
VLLMSRWILLFLCALVAFPVLAQEPDCDAEVCAAVSPALPGLALSEFPAELRPPVSVVPAPRELLNDRMYQRLSGPAEILDAPAGGVVRVLDSGFTFVTTQGLVDDYTQINPDEWVQSTHLTPVWPSTFSGVLFDDPLDYTMAWVLRNTTPSLAPGEAPPEDGVPLMRYERVSIFATEEVDGWRWYQIGPDQWIEQTRVAKVLPVERTPEIDTERWMSIDLYEQVLIAYEGTTPVFASLVSSGLADWPTNEGLFHVYLRNPRAPMSGANAQPDYYDLEEVPWTMYFDGDIAVHGAYWHDGFGYRHSHGCVNMSIADAYWLYQWASPEFDFSVPEDTGSAVFVYSSGVYR